MTTQQYNLERTRKFLKQEHAALKSAKESECEAACEYHEKRIKLYEERERALLAALKPKEAKPVKKKEAKKKGK